MAFSAIVAVDTFDQYLEPVSALVDECKLRLGENGLHISAVEPVNVAMIHADLDASTFESYEANGGVIGVDLGRLEDALGVADADELVLCELDEETRTLDVRIGHLDYTLALIDPDSIRQEPDQPDVDLPVECVIEGDALLTAITAADLCSDHVRFAYDVDAEELIVSAQGDTDDVDYRVDGDDLIVGHAEESCSSLFSLDYLQDVAKPIVGAAEVTLRLGEAHPMVVEYSINEGRGQVETMVAPRIQSG